MKHADHWLQDRARFLAATLAMLRQGAHWSLMVGLIVCAGCSSRDSSEERPSHPSASEASAARPAQSREPVERVEIVGRHWHINGSVTYRGAAAEGLLMNVRMVNAVFEDRRRPDFDPDRNLDAFVLVLPQYANSGVKAITLSLQGGFPGYEGALNSAFERDGGLRHTYMKRLAKAIEAARQQGVVVILSLFYQRQSAVLEDVSAIRRAVIHTMDWVKKQDFRNVVIEIANEYGHRGFVHEILRTPGGQVELIQLAKERAPELLISTSGGGHGRLDPEVAAASDFLLVHFNRTPVEEIPNRAADLRSYAKPIVCNEDDKLGGLAARAARISVQSGVSWGFMHSEQNQYWPFRFAGVEDDRLVYATMLELTSSP